jgi:acyl-CoA synthetase (AMP-forming)/AMP-acid ligase II
MEHEIVESPSHLDEAWERPATFALIPDQSGVSPEWVHDLLTRLPADLATEHFALLTSGSTGRPKLVIGSRRRSERLARALHEAQNSEAVRETINLLPLTYCYSFVNQWLWSRVAGRPMRVTRGFREPDQVRALLERADAAMLCLIGAQLPLFRLSLAGASFEGVIRVHFAGGPFPEKAIAFVRELFPRADVYNNFGCAEAMPRLCVRFVKPDETNIGIGQPLNGIELRSDDESALTFRSCYGAVAEADADGLRRFDEQTWVRTGDLGHYDDQAREWRVLGRVGEVFKRHGEKVSVPALLQTVQENWIGHSAIFREADPMGEPGHVLVLAPGPTEEQLRRVLRGLREKHPRAWWPVRIEAVDALPLLPNGKPNVLALPALPNRVVLWQQRL